MPFPGTTFKVTADEISLGPGMMTVMEDSFIFEAGSHLHVGFDLNTVRLVRVRDINSFDVAYSFQGSIQKASFVTTPKYIRKNEGIEKDVMTDPLGWTMTFWRLHTITGAIVARMVADRSGAQVEGFAPITDVEFDSQFRQMSHLIGKLPPQKEIESGRADQELDTLERKLSDNLLGLTDAWLRGNLSLRQREKVAALDYLDDLRRYELGWYHSTGSERHSEMTNQDYRENAEDWLTEEMKWGSNLREIASARDPSV
jgi:hypothetical protein